MKASDRDHLARVAAIGCLICGRPAEIHHLRSGIGMGQKNSNDNVLPLCEIHHRLGKFGEAIHAGAREFARRHGSEDELLEKVNKILGGEMIHNLKIEQEYLENLLVGIKRAEVRYNDRDYQVGDYLRFYNKKTVSYVAFQITHIHSGLGMQSGYVVLSVQGVVCPLDGGE